MVPMALAKTIWLLFILDVASTVRADAWSASAECCAALIKVLGTERVVFGNDEQYNRSITSYWSVLAQLKPNCVVVPRSSQDVSTAVKTLTQAQWASSKCQFAIRGGGHTPWAGAANIDEGVTIDLSLMNQVTVSEDRTVALVGPGARWGNVYDALDPQGLSVVGGRVASPGVAGLTTGGGISYFTGLYGLACDNVKNYQVVLASGEIVDVNSDSRPDLFRALKGGSNNFGIVTRFDLTTFEQGPLWAGSLAYPENATAQLIPAFVRFTESIEQDPHASLISLFLLDPASNQIVAVMVPVYTKPELSPAPFRELTSIEPKLLNTQGISNMSFLARGAEQDSDDIFGMARKYQATLTIANRADVISRTLEISRRGLETVRSSRNVTWVTSFQPMPRVFSERSAERGGNVLGLDKIRRNSVSFQITFSWRDPSYDEAIYAAGQTIIDEVTRYARSIGAAEDYIYLNYAWPTQDVISSYGPENVARLRAVSRKYDPEQVFQKQVPGGFKLER